MLAEKTFADEGDEVVKLAELIERADLVMLVFGDKRAALGPDMVRRIVTALRRSV